MKDKPRIYITLHNRGALSLHENRQRLAHAAFHWGLLLAPKPPTTTHPNPTDAIGTSSSTTAAPSGERCYTYDVSDGMRLDPETGGVADSNVERTWHFRAQRDVDTSRLTHLVGMVMIGKVPANKPGYEEKDVRTLLKGVRLPEKETEPVQNCVSWTRAAIQELQKRGFVEEFEVSGFMDWALEYADRRVGDTGRTPGVVNYTGRPM